MAVMAKRGDADAHPSDGRPSHVRGRSADHRATPFRAIIASSVFLALLAMTLLVGGHAAIGPLLRSAMAERDAKAVGDIVFAMPDGRFCRHMSFDNATAEMTESAVGPCPDIAARGGGRAKSFAWGEK
jgi:hypothetical protein